MVPTWYCLTADFSSLQMLVFKLARPGNSPETLQRESCWMEYLRSRFRPSGRRFNILVPLTFDDDLVFRNDYKGFAGTRFNATTSLPERIETVGSMAALCVPSKFGNDRYGDAKG